MKISRIIRQGWLGLTSRSGTEYWERRYRSGMDSGEGSYGRLARYKADVLNAFVADHDVRDVIELGCGDGHQLSLARYPRYLGLDVARGAIERCMRTYADDPTKSFLLYDPTANQRLAAFLGADLTISLDVVYHLLEEDTYRRYVALLFDCARRFVIVYSSDGSGSQAPHVRHWNFTADVESTRPDFEFVSALDNPYPESTFARFHIYRRIRG